MSKNTLFPTPTESHIALRTAEFSTLAEALNYAAEGVSGFNFYDGRGKLRSVLPYSVLQKEAQALARRLLGLHMERGSRVAIVAETHPDFPRFFFACQYAGYTPVPLPASIHLGGHKAYVEQIRGLLEKSQATIAVASADFLPYLLEATEGLELKVVGTPQTFDELIEQPNALQPLQANETAYLQYTSGSTRFPRGVMVGEAAVMNNLSGIIKDGLKMTLRDRCVSWLPYYHDMGLVGFVLAPLASQRSVDFLSTRDFAMSPRLWLNLLSENCGTISFGPPFGYDLCARRVRQGDTDQYDLSAWRIAGVGAEPIRFEVLERFAAKLAPFGFNHRAFVPSYGMAECALAISFGQLDQEVIVDEIDAELLSSQKEAQPVSENQTGQRTKLLVNCGAPLPGHEIVIRNEQGDTLPDRKCGTIHVRGPSLMCGYFNDPEETAKVLSGDGWLNTGDIGYLDNGSVFITGRDKDMIIINGRNIWPQDLEFYAEQQPEIRSGDASAIAVSTDDGSEAAVMVIQYRETDKAKQKELSSRLALIIREAIGINCIIELVPAHTLPRTSSGKLSRAGTQRDYLRRQEEQSHKNVKPLFEEQNNPEGVFDLRVSTAGQRNVH